MAFAGGGLNRLSSRDSAPGPRFFFFAILSVVLMYYDQKDGWSSKIRYGMQAAAYPMQVAVGLPRTMWRATSDFFTSRGTLETQNAELTRRDQELSVATMRNAALEQENARLRGLTAALPPLVTKHLLADVVSADLGRLRQRLVVNQGDTAGVYRAQAAIDTDGLVGQTVRVGPFSSELMLITDPEHAVPVEVVRNGLRTIAVGIGSPEELQLPFLPVNSDVKEGDLLVTSGLGGVFPSGIPVGTVIEFARDPDQILARSRARPVAALERDRQVMLLWFDATHPARPVDPKLVTDLPAAPIGQPAIAPGQQSAAKPAVPPSPTSPAATAPAANTPAASTVGVAR